MDKEKRKEERKRSKILPFFNKKKNNSSSKEEDLTKKINIEISDLIKELITDFAEENNIPDDYEFISTDEFYTKFINMINNKEQIVFDTPEMASVFAVILLSSNVDNSISYFEVNEIVTVNGIGFILNPVYNDKRTIKTITDDEDIYRKFILENIADYAYHTVMEKYYGDTNESQHFTNDEEKGDSYDC